MITSIPLIAIIGPLVFLANPLVGKAADLQPTSQNTSQPAGSAPVHQRDSALWGIVRFPNRAPAADIDVLVVSGSSVLNIHNDRVTTSGHEIVLTDETGRFSLPSHTDPQVFVIRHERGYADGLAADLLKSHEVQLQKWGRIEGTFQIAGKPAVRQQVKFDYQPTSFELRSLMGNGPWLLCESYTKTDEKGAFTFERIPPGKARIGRELITQAPPSRIATRVPIDVTPGTTTRIALGAVGRPVIGKLVSRPDQATLTPPPIAMAEIVSHPPGQRSVQPTPQNSLTFTFELEPDGRFRVEDVPAGEYTLSIRLFELKNQRPAGRELGHLTRELTIQKIPNGRTDEPLDLGELKLRSYREKTVRVDRSSGGLPNSLGFPEKYSYELKVSPAALPGMRDGGEC